jgi:hypothetical protein
MHFAATCNDYPQGDKLPKAWENDDERLFLKGGQEMYSGAQKADLIMFLTTL